MPAASHPTGPAYPITRHWQELIKKRIEEMGISQADLARMVGCKPPSITALLKPGAKQSRLVPKIHKALRLARPELPAADEIDEKRVRLAEAFEKLSPEAVDAVLALAESLARASK